MHADSLHQSKLLAPAPRATFVRRALANRTFMLGATIVAGYLIVALFGQALAPYSPTRQALDDRLAGVSWEHPFGRDELGRDLLSRLLVGARSSLAIAGGAVLIGLVCGVVIGGTAGYVGGRIDRVVVWMVDAMLAFPDLLIAIAIISVLGRGLTNLALAIGLAAIPAFIRIARAAFMSIRHEEFIQAAVVLGVPSTRIITRHMLPNAMAPLIVHTTYSVAGAILAASGLSFLGLGVQPPAPEWGVILSRGREYMLVAPHIVAIPGLAIAGAILGLNLLGDGLRDLLDPRLRR